MTSKIYQPENDNILQLSKFQFAVTNLPFANYYCQDVSLPGVSTNSPVIDTPFSLTYHAGDKLTFDPLTLTILCDEDMRVWEETFDWLSSLTFPQGYKQYAQVPIYREGILILLKNSNLNNFKIKFHNIHPLSMGGLRFSTKLDANEPPVFDVTLRYDTFTIDRS